MRRGGKLDLLIGVVLGLVLGVVVAYLLVIVVGNSRDVSPISTPQQSPPGREATSGTGPSEGSRAPRGQRR